MLSYETLDGIADSINPLLGILALALPWLRRRGMRLRALILNLLTIGAVAVAYAGQALDAGLRLWVQGGLDYSTHTAVFTAIASSLWQQGNAWRWVSALVGAGYAALMLWQRYHSLLDILTTAAGMVVALVAFWWVARRLIGSKAFP